MSARRPTRNIFLEFLGSMNLAISLLLFLAVASIIGTILEQNQPYPDYVIDFGPFWFDVFRVFGFYDVYSAGWFLVILGFLLVSTGVCLVRNGPTILRDAKTWRLGVTRKSLQYGRHSRQWTVPDDMAAADAVLQAGLQQAGYRVRAEPGPGHTLIAARRGEFSRWGYVFTHLAIVVICLGGLMDSRMGVKIADVAGLIEPETRNLRASQIPDVSRLPAWNPAFRASVKIKEGMGANVAFVNLRDGFLVQPLPFTVELREFRVLHHTTGQPKSFESDLIIHDPDLDEPIVQTIKVNEPLRHRGYSIYQSSFADGGSGLDIRAWPLLEPGEPVSYTANVDDSGPFVADEAIRIEYEDFDLHNVNRVTDPDGSVVQRNFGPSFDYRVRNRAGDTLEYRNYMFPVEREGRFFLLSGVRAGADYDFQYMYIPVDAENSVDRFMNLLAAVSDPDRVRDAAERTVGDTVRGTALDTAEHRDGLLRAMDRLVDLFRQHGFEAVWNDIEPRVSEERREAVIGAYMRVLQGVLATLYRDVLAAEGVGDPGDEEWQFFQDAVTAINAIGDYGSGWYLQLESFEHRQSSGLQIARSPGMGVVYFGSLMLVIGIFLMFYVDHRRLWLWLESDEKGTQVLLAGASTRNTLDFQRNFEQLADTLERGTTNPSRE